MRKSKRYKLTEGQVKSTVRFISENYPTGVGDHNIDQISGAYGGYSYIEDVKYDTNMGDLQFDVVTDGGKTVTKTIWAGDDKLILPVEKELQKQGYNLEEEPEWDLVNVSLNNHHVIFIIADYKGKTYTVPIQSSTVLEWIPEMEEDDYYDEPPNDW